MQDRSHVLYSPENESLLQGLQDLLCHEKQIREERSRLRKKGHSASKEHQQKLQVALQDKTDDLDHTYIAMRGPFDEAIRSEHQTSCTCSSLKA